MPEGEDRFCWSVKQASYINVIRELLAKAGMDWSPPMHSLRSSLETDWMRKHSPMAVCKWLGHDPKIAMQHYVKADEFIADVTRVFGQIPEAMADSHLRTSSED